MRPTRIRDFEMKNTVYILSLAILAISIFLILNYPDSGRINLIAGGLAFIGLLLNVAGFMLPKENLKRGEV